MDVHETGSVGGGDWGLGSGECMMGARNWGGGMMIIELRWSSVEQLVVVRPPEGYLHCIDLMKVLPFIIMPHTFYYYSALSYISITCNSIFHTTLSKH